MYVYGNCNLRTILMVIVLSVDVFVVKKTASPLGHRLFCCNFVILIEYMITDHDSVTAVVTSEVCQISHIGYSMPSPAMRFCMAAAFAGLPVPYNSFISVVLLPFRSDQRRCLCQDRDNRDRRQNHNNYHYCNNDLLFHI